MLVKLKRVWIVHHRFLMLLLLFSFLSDTLSAQQFRSSKDDIIETKLSFEMAEASDVNMVFNTHQSYQLGKTIMNALVLGVVAEGVNWNFYVAADTEDSANPDEWEQVLSYSQHGTIPRVSDLEVRVRNTANTSDFLDFFPLRNTDNPVYIIPEVSETITCPERGTNSPGSYLTQPECFRFRIDYRFKPTYDMQPGLYRLLVVYVISENL
ncbi:MAG: hypothetical protein EA361_13140 [Bacteroidetes bacterium]|nr:MAG: hypothetical protein EA361_13140 [Bacteroidota bacterium]